MWCNAVSQNTGRSLARQLRPLSSFALATDTNEFALRTRHTERHAPCVCVGGGGGG